jgi:GrpB-like predicted nucleotidyltransferase (UPF0157 family)
MLRVGLVGDDILLVARRLNELNADGEVVILVRPARDAVAECHLIIGVGVSSGSTSADADIWLDETEAVDELWHNRLVPFAANLAMAKRAPRLQRAVICEADPAWPVQANRLITRLSAAIGDHALRIDHIGSTSVSGLSAKDLIDIQVVVSDLDSAARVGEAARVAGFVRVAGPLWCADRHGARHSEEVVVDADPGRPANVNIRPVTAPIWRETLLFRDWLRADAVARSEYLALKRDLAARPGADVNQYGADKIPWIAAAAGRAEHWAEETGWTP